MTTNQGDRESGGLRALALVCSLKSSPAASSSQLLAQQLLHGFSKQGVVGEAVRIADYNVAPGVGVDMGAGDDWPGLRDKILAADIVVFATPTWLGHMSSFAQRVLERLDAELSETDDAGQPSLFGKVAVVAVVGNEDGAHKIVADSYQALCDVGFTIPAQGCTYWNHEAMNPKDYKDLDSTPEAVRGTNRTLVANAVHTATLLQKHPYPVT